MSDSTINKTSRNGAPTLRDVATYAGVNTASVSSVLNGSKSNTRVSQSTRERILEAAAALNYQANPFAQRLAHGRCDNAIPIFALNLYAGVAVEKVLAIQKKLQEHNYYVPLHAYGFAGADQERTQVTMISEIRRQLPRAIVCSTGGLFEGALAELRLFQETGGLLVSYDYETKMDCDQVVLQRRGGELAVRHLAGLGHTRIGMCAHGRWREEGPEAIQFLATLRKLGLEFRRDWMFSGGNHEEGGARLAQWWLRLPVSDRPSAIFVINDRSASAFTTQVQRAGLNVPHDVSVVGFDNSLLASYAPVPLTTISHPAEIIGEQTAQLVLDRLQGNYDGPARRVVVPSELVRRESTSAPN